MQTYIQHLTITEYALKYQKKIVKIISTLTLKI